MCIARRNHGRLRANIREAIEGWLIGRRCGDAIKRRRSGDRSRRVRQISGRELARDSSEAWLDAGSPSWQSQHFCDDGATGTNRYSHSRQSAVSKIGLLRSLMKMLDWKKATSRDSRKLRTPKVSASESFASTRRNFCVVQRKSVSNFRVRPAGRMRFFAPLAQLAEQVTLNHWVVGSIPTRCTFSNVGARIGALRPLPPFFTGVAH